MRLLFRFFGFLFAVGTIVFLVGIAAAAGMMWHYSKDLPDYSQLQDYEPPVMTRVHAADGSLIAEYARERRLYLPIQAMPKLVINALPRRPRTRTSTSMAASTSPASRAPADPVCAELRLRPPPAGRLDHHPAGRQELPADQRQYRSTARSRKRCWRCASSAPIPRTRSSSSISTRSISASAPTASPPRR